MCAVRFRGSTDTVSTRGGAQRWEKHRNTASLDISLTTGTQGILLELALAEATYKARTC